MYAMVFGVCFLCLPAWFAASSESDVVMTYSLRHHAPLSGSRYCKKVVISVPGVFLTEDEYNFDIALRRFKKQVEKAGILSEMKKRQHYEKPSVMRKKKKAAARKRLLKKMRKINMG